jgi:hypothetical protein
LPSTCATIGSPSQTGEPLKAPPRSSKALVAISKGILKGNKYAPLREAPEFSRSVGPIPQQMFSNTQTVLLKVAESCSVPVGVRKAVRSPVLGEGDVGSPVIGEFPGNNVIFAFGSHLVVAGDLGVSEAPKN